MSDLYTNTATGRGYGPLSTDAKRPVSYDRLMRALLDKYTPQVSIRAIRRYGIMKSAEQPRSNEGKLKNVIDSETQLTT